MEKELTLRREVRIDKIVFKVTAVFRGGKDLEKIITDWAFEKTLAQIKTA